LLPKLAPLTVFAIFFDYFTEAQKQEVASTVINNPSVKPFTSPFMQFYELAALCSLGNLSQVLERIRKQWNSSLLKAQLSSPLAVVVSIFSWMDLKPIPRSLNIKVMSLQLHKLAYTPTVSARSGTA
jgi:hypothetical protein